MTNNKNPKQRGMGRGLDAILGISNPDNSIVSRQSPSRIKENEFTEININLIDANPWQPRNDFEDEALQELCLSIKEHGLIQPVTVRSAKNGRYQLIAGERRLRACKMAGFTAIAAYIRSASDMQMLEMGLIENIQRKDLNPIEIALSFQRLINECNLKQEELSAKVAKSRPVITNYLRLLKLCTPVQQYICEGKISMGHAKALAGITDGDIQKTLAEKIISMGLSVRQAEEMAKKAGTSALKKTKIKLPAHFVGEEKKLAAQYKTKVNIKRNIKGKGSINLHFSSDNELERLLFQLTK
ncbi:MAG: ParB/RepB/Spo0J family partition protein [Bacteroidales bacterium]|nr:ParB/RepB/Spo0J family partition protein [Bacteroidales bacterium]